MYDIEDIIIILNHPNSPHKLKKFAWIHWCTQATQHKSKNNTFKTVTNMDTLVNLYGALFCRAYRMDVDSFYELHRILEDNLKNIYLKVQRHNVRILHTYHH